METVSAAAAGLGYPDSVESSPRSRGGESWDEPFPSSAAPASSKLRLMCSFGGRIVPRPTDKSLCYLGGETRIVVVERHSTLADLSTKLSRSLLGGRPFSLKYQLPNEDLDSLISVTTDEDLDNMIEEYDRILSSSAASGNASATGGSTRSSRLRLFLFPSKPESAPSSIGSLLDDSKSETWFVDALNNAMGMGIDGLPRGLSTDSASVNCLLGLEDDSSVHSRGGVGAGREGGAGGSVGGGAATEPEQLTLPRPDSSGKLARHGQDVHSVPDSPMLETTSSFGSTSSAPSLSNLPPIRVRPDDRPPDQRYGPPDDHFSQMNLSSAANASANANANAAAVQRQEEGFKDPGFPPHHPHPPPPIPLPTPSTSTPTISPTENPNRGFSSDDEKFEHGGARKLSPQQPTQQKPTPLDAPISDSMTRPVYYQERVPSAVAAAAAAAANPISDTKRELPIAEPTYRLPVSDSGYMLPQMQPEQLQQHLHQHPLPHQHQQFVHANPHYVQHPTTNTVVPMTSYYQVPHSIQQSQQSHPFDQQIPMYYMPVRQNPQHVPLSKVPTKPEIPANLYRTAAAPGAPAPLIHMAADQGHQYTGMGYHLMQHHHPSQSPTATMTNYGYEYATDAGHPQQVYYTQATSQPSMPPQYQTVVSSATVISEVQPGELKQTRAS